MFKSVPPKLHINQMEESVLRIWKHRHIFEKTSQLREGAPEFVFYEGPPSANGRPGVHHVLARVFKDMFLRYKTMCGYHVARRGGWDTHGLPIELEVEKQLGFNSKTEIEEYGIAAFNELCRQSAFEYILEWERLTERIAYWVALDDAYLTYTNDYIESVWWIIKSFWEKGLLYQGFKVVPYCPRCGTPLSDHEVAQGYEQTVNPSVYVRLPLIDDPGTSLLVWTTTPWTLPGNVAVAAHPDMDYVIIERNQPEGGREKLILAKSQVESIFKDEPVEVGETFKGKKLKGLQYHPLFTFITPDKPAYHIILDGFVSVGDGTGLVHIAPAFGAADLRISIDYDLPILQTVADDGTFIPEIRPWSGKFVKDADPLIIRDLEDRGLLFYAGTSTHTYPFCWRCATPLLYSARGTWYLRTTQYKDQLVELNQRISWHPEHFREGRFGNWLENNVDWALGRERYWGTPLPVWDCQSCHHQLAVGSIVELNELSGKDHSELDLHRPYIDEVTIPCPECKGSMERVKELIDVWFDSGAMPTAQWHYPFENEEIFKTQYPADFICEGVDQTRGWFYSLHAISTMLFDREAYRHVICLGLVLDADGKKMSKSLGNIVDPWEVINTHGSDAFRWYLITASPPGQDRRFSIDMVGEVVRNFTLTLWNVYSFFITYANIDQWNPQTEKVEIEKIEYPSSNLDRWLLSELNLLVKEITNAYESYDTIQATRPLQAFMNVLSRWYLRRSRRRFWRDGSDMDKLGAYSTLYQTLVTLSKLLAPSMPLLAEEFYQNLVCSVDKNAPQSVHMTAWPEPDMNQINEKLNQEMRLVIKLASLGHAARNQAAIKVRQPLQEASLVIPGKTEQLSVEQYAGLLAEELNVKHVRIMDSAKQVTSYSLNPLPEQLGKKYKSKFPGIQHAILALDPDQAALSLLKGHPIEVSVEGEVFQIQPEEVEVRPGAVVGTVIASEGPYLVAINTRLTPGLINEGIARELVRQIQELRKQADFDITDRILIYYQASPKIKDAIQVHQGYILKETLAVELLATTPPREAASLSPVFKDEQVVLGIIKTT
jgi:isoleucyl-tRNA synthetase